MAVRAGLYARYSTDMQREASIEDQLRDCSRRANQDGYEIYNTYADYGISGATLHRPAMQNLLEDARNGRINAIITESIDRLSRDQEDIAHIYKRMSFNDIKVITLSEGIVNELHVGLKGTMGALYLKDQADKTRRGLRGRVEAGKSGGGKCYGYDVVRKMDEAGNPITGERTINEGQAININRIFNLYAEGKSPRAIAFELNNENIPAPNGKAWGASTINGNKNRGTGILNNDLYRGKLVWNRLRYIKDPDTGKRVSRLNFESEWIIKDVPELRIIDENAWQAAKDRQNKVSLTTSAKNGRKMGMWDRKRPKYLFSGLMICGTCGGGMIHVNAERVGCATARNKGTCDNLTTLPRDKLEHEVFDGLSKRLMNPELFEVFCKRYTARMNELTAQHNATLNHERNELTKTNKELDKLVQAIIDGVPGSHLKDRIGELEAKKAALTAKLETAEEKPVLLHTGMAELYRKQVSNLIPLLNQPEHRTRASEIIRGLIEQIVLTQTTDAISGQKTLKVSIKGHLAGILSMALNAEKPLDESDLCIESVKLVAGAGFEPATFRL
ncbi:MAG: recombinase family protein [Sneathiella sp.]